MVVFLHDAMSEFGGEAVDQAQQFDLADIHIELLRLNALDDPIGHFAGQELSTPAAFGHRRVDKRQEGLLDRHIGACELGA